MAEKDNDLQNWRRERDQLVAALEAQLTSLASSNTQKDKEIEELKKTALKAPGKVSGKCLFGLGICFSATAVLLI